MPFYPSGFRIADPLIGGMGVGYLCFDHQGQRPVALKTFKPEYLAARATRERFQEERNTRVRLGKHSHIVQAYEVVRIGDGREVYLVLELMAKEEGRTDASLRSWLTQGRPLSTDQPCSSPSRSCGTYAMPPRPTPASPTATSSQKTG